MAKLIGTWAPATLEGERVIVVDGVDFKVPEDAVVKIVHGSRFEIAHAKVGREVFVFSKHGQLVEDELQRRSRAMPHNFNSVVGERI